MDGDDSFGQHGEVVIWLYVAIGNGCVKRCCVAPDVKTGVVSDVFKTQKCDGFVIAIGKAKSVAHELAMRLITVDEEIKVAFFNWPLAAKCSAVDPSFCASKMLWIGKKRVYVVGSDRQMKHQRGSGI